MYLWTDMKMFFTQNCNPPFYLHTQELFTSELFICEQFPHKTLEGTAYVTRQAVHTVAAIRKAKKAIRKAFENSMNGKGSNLVEIV